MSSPSAIFTSIQAKQTTKEYNKQKKKKSCAIESIANSVAELCETENYKLTDVLRGIVRHLKLEDFVKFEPDDQIPKRKEEESVLEVWKYWHEVSTLSTNTNDVATIRVEQKPCAQLGLSYDNEVTQIDIRGISHFRHTWKTVVKSYYELYTSFEETHTCKISYGQFFSLKPFYVRHASTKDLVMCCCKIHLHARWSINAMITLLSKQQIDFPVHNYNSFFTYLYEKCDKDNDAYISWTCVNPNILCPDIESKWDELKAIASSSHDNETTSFTEFQKVTVVDKKTGESILNKKGQPSKRLTPINQQVNASYLINFIENLLPSLIYHRNMLQHYRSTIKQFKDMSPSLYTDIDFSENLTLGMKFEPQSMHWVRSQITIHAAILFLENEKQYHAYSSDDRVHDQAFVKLAIQQIFRDVEIPTEMKILIESDNCSSQYKSSQHFHDLQLLANQFNRTVIRVFGIAGHGKGEVDHVGGVVKVAARQEINRGRLFTNAQEVNEFLCSKFEDKTTPTYKLCEITVAELAKERLIHKRKVYKTIAGSSSFHVMIFEPNSTSFLASPRICICASCRNKIG